jgi:hypothetical protein
MFEKVRERKEPVGKSFTVKSLELEDEILDPPVVPQEIIHLWSCRGDMFGDKREERQLLIFEMPNEMFRIKRSHERGTFPDIRGPPGHQHTLRGPDLLGKQQSMVVILGKRNETLVTA